MADIRRLVEELEKACLESNVVDHPYFMSWWDELKEKIAEEFPETVDLVIGRVYSFRAKRGRIARGVCTKENQKTFVVYEIDGSGRPGCRWMISKAWCLKDNIWEDHKADWSIPAHVTIK